jgi:hypothetical protein
MIILILIWLTSFFIMLALFFDCWTTSTMINNITDEKNPFVRKLMRKFGIQPVIWGIFVLYFVIVALFHLLIKLYPVPVFFKIGFIIIGITIAFLHFFVALANETGRLNIIALFVLKIFNKMQ